MPGSLRASVAVVILSIGGLCSGCSDSGDVENPGARPAAPPGFTFVNPLARAKAGDHAVYTMPDRKTLRFEVLGVNPVSGRVTVLEEQRDTKVDKLVVNETHEYLPNEFLTGFGDFQVVKLASETIKAGGRSWDCVAVDMVSLKLGNVRAWFSSDVPVLGLVKRMRVGPGAHDGLVLLEIEEWSGK